jgi:hypothetical protein
VRAGEREATRARRPLAGAAGKWTCILTSSVGLSALGAWATAAASSAYHFDPAPATGAGRAGLLAPTELAAPRPSISYAAVPAPEMVSAGASGEVSQTITFVVPPPPGRRGDDGGSR